MFVPDRKHIEDHPLKIERTTDPIAGLPGPLESSYNVDVRC